MSAPAHYRFDPLDHSGVLFGLSLGGCVAVAVALAVAVVGLTLGLPLGVVAVAPIAAAIAVTPGPSGRPLVERVPPLDAWRRTRPRRRAWFAELRAASWWQDPPPCLQGIRPVADVAVEDRQRGTATIILRLFGPQLALRSADAHDLALDLWGDVLNQFAADPDVAAVSWSDFVAPNRTPGGDAASGIDDDVHAGAVEHECLLALTLRVARGDLELRCRRLAAAAFQALAAAGIAADPVVEPAQLALLVAHRADPDATTTGRPLAVEGHWTHCRIDGSLHRTLWIAGWPQLPVTAGWLERFLAVDGVTRTLSVTAVPVAPHRARRQIERDLVKLESEATTRNERGRRVDARHRRNTQTLLDRERELVDGHAEYAYVGLVTVTAPDLARLDDATALVTQRALESGLDLRPLHGRHDLGWAAGLPLGLAPRMASE